jgi:hypothetical protein
MVIPLLQKFSLMLSNEKIYLVWWFTPKISVVMTSTELVLLTVTNLLPLLFAGLFSISSFLCTSEWNAVNMQDLFRPINKIITDYLCFNVQ